MDKLPEVDYIASGPNCDCGPIVSGLREVAKAHAASLGRARLKGVRQLTEDYGMYSPQWNGETHEMEECFLGYYNNFELLRADRFASSPVYRSWVSAIDANGGIYRHRWGDALLRRVGCALMQCKVHRTPGPWHPRLVAATRA